MSESNVSPKDYWAGFPEAPFSDTIKWTDGNGFDHMTTFRGWTFNALYETLAKAEAHILETGGKPNGAKPAPAQTAAPAPATQAGNVLSITKIKVTPEVKDGKSRIMVELYADGHQWADIKAFFNDANAAKTAFGMVTGADFSVAGEYTFNPPFAADYRNSDKLNSKGNPYKNLVQVRPLD